MSSCCIRPWGSCCHRCCSENRHMLCRVVLARHMFKPCCCRTLAVYAYIQVPRNECSCWAAVVPRDGAAGGGALLSGVQRVYLGIRSNRCRIVLVGVSLLKFEQESVCCNTHASLLLVAPAAAAGGVRPASLTAAARLYNQQLSTPFPPTDKQHTCCFVSCTLCISGSGKTYQMGGPNSLQPDPNNSSNSAAILPQACAQLLQHATSARAVYDVQIKVMRWLLKWRCCGGGDGGACERHVA